MPSGIGGHMMLPGTPNITIRVEEWTLDKQIDSADVTDSGSNNWRDREALLKDATGTANIIYRLGASFEDRSLEIGDQGIAVFLFGSTGQGYTVFLQVKSISTTNPGKGNDVIKQRLSWEHVEDGVIGPAPVALASVMTEEIIERVMARAEEEERQAERIARQWQERLEEIRHGPRTGRRTGNRRAWANQYQRPDVAREPATAQ